jgi:hypothetical protein
MGHSYAAIGDYFETVEIDGKTPAPAHRDTDHGLEAAASATVAVICRPTVAMGNFVPAVSSNRGRLIVR